MTNKIAYLSKSEADISILEEQLANIDHEIEVHVCTSPGETIEAVKYADIIISANIPITREIIGEIKNATAIMGSGHGFDFIDHEAATEKGLMVINNAGFCTDEVANHAIMLLIACAKHLTLLNQQVKSGIWERPLGRLPLPPITGEVLGLVGFGNIARATAVRASALGMDVITYDPYVPPWTIKEYRVTLIPSLTDLAANSDYVSMHTPLNMSTRRMLNESFFKAMKSTAYFINTCRGGTVDEHALIKALEKGEIAGAGLDVFEEEPTPPDNPLLKMDNVIATPHSAGHSDVVTIASQKNTGQEAARILSGTWPMSLVNPVVRSQLPSRPPATNM